jgi:hypothetical protein
VYLGFCFSPTLERQQHCAHTCVFPFRVITPRHHSLSIGTHVRQQHMRSLKHRDSARMTMHLGLARVMPRLLVPCGRRYCGHVPIAALAPGQTSVMVLSGAAKPGDIATGSLPGSHPCRRHRSSVTSATKARCTGKTYRPVHSLVQVCAVLISRKFGCVLFLFLFCMQFMLLRQHKLQQLAVLFVLLSACRPVTI